MLLTAEERVCSVIKPPSTVKRGKRTNYNRLSPGEKYDKGRGERLEKRENEEKM